MKILEPDRFKKEMRNCKHPYFVVVRWADEVVIKTCDTCGRENNDFKGTRMGPYTNIYKRIQE